MMRVTQPALRCALRSKEESSRVVRFRRSRIRRASSLSSSSSPSPPSEEAEKQDATPDPCSSHRLSLANGEQLFMSATLRAKRIASKSKEISMKEAVRIVVREDLQHHVDVQSLRDYLQFASMASQAGSAELTIMLETLSKELVLAAGEGMPAEVKLLNRIVEVDSEEERQAILKAAEITGCESTEAAAAAVARTCGVLIEDMESTWPPIDGSLHLSMCLARESARAVAGKRGGSAKMLGSPMHRSMMPQAEVSLCGHLVSLSSELERRGFFNALARTALGSEENREEATNDSRRPEYQILENVRPGRLFDVLSYLEEEATDEARFKSAPESTVASRTRLLQHLRRMHVEYRGEIERAIGAGRRETRKARQSKVVGEKEETSEDNGRGGV